ncbi:MAG: hypothetical protein E7505_00030 [Ruminococcus sp.]|nr:hypothetical protein [Ruminococcus sp.]
MRSKKSILQYCASFTVLSIIQLIIINGLIKSDSGNKTTSELSIDGADFSPFVSLVSSGVNSFAFFISELSTVILGVIFSLILMLIVRRFSNKTIEKEEKKFNSRYTLIASFVFLIIISALSHFNLIADILIMYITVPITSWLAFHLGKKISTGQE